MSVWGITHNAVNDYVYVGYDSSKTAELDTNTNEVIDTIRTSSNPDISSII
jgi:hypothetical protein